MAIWPRLMVVWWVAVLVASGCGGSDEPLSKADFQDEILAVIDDAAEPTRLYTELVVESRPREECAAGIATLEEQVDTLVDRISALRPPAQVQAIHDDFVAAARTSVDRVGDVREDFAAGEVSCGDELNQELYGMRSTREAERAIARLEAQGYFVFGE
jgi:hypothetical protein